MNDTDKGGDHLVVELTSLRRWVVELEKLDQALTEPWAP